MKTKTYRVKMILADEATKRATEYVAEERELITESEMIGAAIEKGLKEITNEEISEMVIKQRQRRHDKTKKLHKITKIIDK